MTSTNLMALLNLDEPLVRSLLLVLGRWTSPASSPWVCYLRSTTALVLAQSKLAKIGRIGHLRTISDDLVVKILFVIYVRWPYGPRRGPSPEYYKRTSEDFLGD